MQQGGPLMAQTAPWQPRRFSEIATRQFDRIDEYAVMIESGEVNNPHGPGRRRKTPQPERTPQ